jgi:D-amino peptidase
MNKKLVLALASALILLAASGVSQQKRLKVLLLYDMEGVSGASSERHTHFGSEPEYTAGRTSLTADVNAAVAGLKAAGAAEIVVVDGHGSGNAGPDVLEADLLPPARMISRDRPFDIYMDSYDQSFDAVVAVGMHCGAGHPDGFISHTYTVEDVRYRVNGVPFDETMILAMGAARFGIPVIMVSGDDQLEEEIERFLPWIKYATGKRAVSRAKAEPYAREEVSRRIEKAAREALLGLAEARLPRDFNGPYRFTLTFQSENQAETASELKGAELLDDGLSVEIRAADFEDGYRRSLRLISLALLAGRVENIQRALAARPDGKELMDAARQFRLERWFDPKVWQAGPAGSSSTTGTEKPRRYFGAR